MKSENLSEQMQRIDDAASVRAEVREIVKEYKSTISALTKRVIQLEAYLDDAGWGPCNIPARNCNGWHKLRSSTQERLLSEVAEEVLLWASTSQEHGGNPYLKKFVQLAQEAVRFSPE